MTAEEHAPLAPSSAPQWGYCPGSVRAQAGIPDPDSAQSREGTAAHWVMADMLERFRGRGEDAPFDGHGEYVGRTAPNGVVIDDKMVEGAQVIVDDVIETWARFDFEGELLIEHRVYMPRIHPQNWGTLDVGLYLARRQLLFVWDYKHGHREHVAKGHLQLADYAAGLVEKYGIDGLQDQQIRACLRIVQPYCYHSKTGPISEWIGFLSELRGAWNLLAAQAHAAFANPTLTAGKHCRDCKALVGCPAARRGTYDLLDAVNQPYQMDDMGGADLAAEYQALKDGLVLANARLGAVEDSLRHRIKAGDSDSGLTLETSWGREEWAVPPAQALALAAQFGVDISKPAVLTPNQTRQAAPKEVRELLAETMKDFTRRAAKALVLVPIGESRTARAFQRRK